MANYELVTPTTWNPDDKYTTIVLSEGNLVATKTGGSEWDGVRSIYGASYGKYYFELIPNGTLNIMGVATIFAALHTNAAYLSHDANGWVCTSQNSNFNHNASPIANDQTVGANDVLGVALDMDNGKLWFSSNGVWSNGGNPATGVNPIYDDLTGTIYAACENFAAGIATRANFGATAMQYPAPTGFVTGFGEIQEVGGYQRPDRVSGLYHVDVNLRGVARQGYARPTLADHFSTVKDFNYPWATMRPVTANNGTNVTANDGKLVTVEV